MSSKISKKKNKNNVKGNVSGKEPVFIVEKDGKAYFKDKKLAIICKQSKIVTPKYPGYMWEFDYLNKLDWFKKIVALMMVNNGHIKFIGMDADQFNNLGGIPIHIEGVDLKKVSSLKIKK